MCVINVIDNNVYPSKEIIKAMSDENPHGNSITFFDEMKGKIIYHKAISLKELNRHLDYCKKNNFKTILHFRIASVGSSENKQLNHPFEIINANQTQLHNETNNSILIHNGTMSMQELNDIALKIMLKDKKAKYPQGELSDTKLMSWILSHVDYSILNMFTNGNKFAIMNGYNGNITTYGNYTKVKDNDNMMLCSNNYFENNNFDGLFDKYGLTEKTTQKIKGIDNEYSIWLDNKEKKEIKRILKKFKGIIDKDDIEQYLDLGYDVWSIEDIINDELRYMEHSQYD